MAVVLLGGGLPGALPTDFAGLQLWFDAAQKVYTDQAGTTPAVDGNTVRAWRSVNNDYKVQDGGAGTGPILDVDLVNGRPALRFDAVNDILLTNTNDADQFLSASAFTAFTVARYADATPARNNIFLFHDGTNSIQLIGNLAGNPNAQINNYDGSDDFVSPAATLTNWNITTGMHSGGNLYGGVNDTRTASLASTASGNTSFGANTNLFIKGAPVTYRAVDIAEIIYFSTALTEDERKQIEIRLAFKYGITLPY